MRASACTPGAARLGRQPIAGVKDRATNRVSAAVVPATDGAFAHALRRRAEVYTDEHGAYHGLPRHRTVKHSVGEYVNGQAHTNGIESFWSVLKRGYYGTYHRMSPKHLDRYVGEFAGRHNDRPLDTVDQLRAIVRGMVGKRLRYRELIS